MTALQIEILELFAEAQEPASHVVGRRRFRSALYCRMNIHLTKRWTAMLDTLTERVLKRRQRIKSDNWLAQQGIRAHCQREAPGRKR